MFERIKKRFVAPPKPATPPLTIKGFAPIVNPTPQQRELRSAARLHRLYLALDQKGYHPDDHDNVLREISIHHANLIGFGHQAPVNADEAHVLVKKIEAKQLTE